MQENLIFTRKEQEFLLKLAKNQVDFIIVGLSAAALQGAPVVTQDIDLWFKDLTDPQFRKVLQQVHGTYIPPFGLNPPRMIGEGLELFDLVLTMHGLASFEEEIQNTISIPLQNQTLKVLALERIILSKESACREKDKIVLPVLKDTLKALNALK